MQAGTGRLHGCRAGSAPLPVRVGTSPPGVPLFLPEPPEPSAVIQVAVLPDRPWLSLSVPSVHPPKSTTPSWRWLAPTLSLADPGRLPTASPATLSRSWVPVERAALLRRRVLPHLARCCFSQQHFLPFCSTVWGTELNGPKHPEDIFATLDLDPEVFGQGLCCVYP